MKGFSIKGISVTIFFLFLITVMSGCLATASPVVQVNNPSQEAVAAYKAGVLWMLDWVEGKCKEPGYFVLGQKTDNPRLIQCTRTEAKAL